LGFIRNSLVGSAQLLRRNIQVSALEEEHTGVVEVLELSILQTLAKKTM
jgi:hypothetical protein